MEPAVTPTAPVTAVAVDWPTDAIGSTTRPRAGASQATAELTDPAGRFSPKRSGANGSGRRSPRRDVNGSSTTRARARARAKAPATGQPATEPPAAGRRKRASAKDTSAALPTTAVEPDTLEVPAATDGRGSDPKPEWATEASSDPREAQAIGAPALTGTARIPQFRLPALIAMAIVAILIAATAYLGLQLQQDSSLNSLRSSAVGAAKTYGGYLSSYDYKDLTGKGSAWAKVEANATASFRKDFSATSGSLGKLLTQYNATAKGKVIAAGVSSLTSSRAVVLLFLDQTVTNTVQKPNSVTQPLRVELTMLRQHGRWLIDNLQVPK
ncbi:MAG: hypothetical protein ACRDYY_13830 [Acidimicrobiales bacterium]